MYFPVVHHPHFSLPRVCDIVVKITSTFFCLVIRIHNRILFLLLYIFANKWNAFTQQIPCYMLAQRLCWLCGWMGVYLPLCMFRFLWMNGKPNKRVTCLRRSILLSIDSLDIHHSGLRTILPYIYWNCNGNKMKGFSFFYFLFLFYFLLSTRNGWLNAVLLVSFFFVHSAICSKDTAMCKQSTVHGNIKSIHFKRKFCSNLLSLYIFVVGWWWYSTNKILWFRPSPTEKNMQKIHRTIPYRRTCRCRCRNQTLFDDAWLKRNVQKLSINLDSSWQRQRISCFYTLYRWLLHFFRYQSYIQTELW